MKNKRMLYPDLLWILKLDLISTVPILGVLLSTASIFLLSALTVRLPNRLPLTKKLV